MILVHFYAFLCFNILFICCLEKHRGFAFVEFELAEDAAAAIDNMVSL